MDEMTKYRKSILWATSVSYVVVILDTSIVNIALAHIAATLCSDVSGLQWVVNAYPLMFASLLMTGGLLGDRLGAKSVYMTGLLLFATASAVCGAAPDLATLVGARVLQGVGAALFVPCSLTLISTGYPDARERAGAISVWAGCGGVAMAAGPLAGGLLVHWFGWRSIFFVNVPLAIIGAWLTWRIPRPSHRPGGAHIDLAGQAAVIVALATSISILIEGAKLGWASAPILSGIALSAGAWLCFLAIERRHPQAMLPPALFRLPMFPASAFVSMASALVFYGLLFLLSLYLQEGRGWSSWQTGLAFLPLTVLVAGGSFSAGLLCRAYGTRNVVVGGFLLYALGFAGLLGLSSETSYWRLALSLPAIGFGSGVVTPAVTAAVMGTIDTSRAGIAAGVLNASRQSGSAFGVALFGALMSTARTPRQGILMAALLAIGLSLVAAACWRTASRHGTGTGNFRAHKIRQDDAKTE